MLNIASTCSGSHNSITNPGIAHTKWRPGGYSVGKLERALIMKPRVLTVGMDEVLVGTRTAILRRSYEAAASTPAAALEKLRKEHYDLLLVCYSTPHEQGTALIHKIREEFPSLRIVRLLSHESPHIEKPVADKLVVVDFRAQVWVQAIDELLTLTDQSSLS